MKKPQSNGKEKPPDEPGISPAKLTDEEISLRKKWLDLTATDEESIRELQGALEQWLDGFMTDLYRHFLEFDETKKFFPTEEVLAKARIAQKLHLRTLATGNFGREYAHERVRVGETHSRIGLDVKWYLGAYCRALIHLSKVLQETVKDRQRADEVLTSLTKLIFFDMGLGIETYNAAELRAIQTHEEQIVKLETERLVTRSMVESAPVGIVRLDRDFSCIEVNEEFISIIRRSPAEVIGASIFNFFENIAREPYEAVARTGVATTITSCHLRATDQQEIRFYDCTIWPVKDDEGTVSGLVATYGDVTDTVRLEQQREDFVATLTHDLKTPILAANRALKLLRDGDFGPVQETQKSIIQNILESNDDMYKMVLTLLDVYKYDSGAKQLNVIPADLVGVVERTVVELHSLSEQKHIKLTIESASIDLPVLCDVEEIRRVLQNLIDNSLKFTPRGGSITVKIDQKSREFTHVYVTDTGKGITDENKPKLFQRFWQATSGGRYYASTGLGLYLCRKIVESHGGRIWCRSELGRGSTFAFTLPNLMHDEKKTRDTKR